MGCLSGQMTPCLQQIKGMKRKGEVVVEEELVGSKGIPIQTNQLEKKNFGKNLGDLID